MRHHNKHQAPKEIFNLAVGHAGNEPANYHTGMKAVAGGFGELPTTDGLFPKAFRSREDGYKTGKVGKGHHRHA
ncbi:MAG: hypothetical protein P4N59_03315 [Negativicutes bacterium]|nr:hypothetical protein [Negativicutes bacterium]